MRYQKQLTMQQVTLNQKEQAIVAILANYGNLNMDAVTKLIEATNGVSGVSFVSIKGYSSDKSENTELANHVINIGASYQNMLNKDAVTLDNINLDNIDVNNYNYDTVDTANLSLDAYKQAVKDMLPTALAEMQAPKAKKDTSADIWLNKALVFNLNTLRLSIFGQSMTKETVIKGDLKKVKSAPKTIAKKLIEKACKSRTAAIRRFTLDNTLANINLKGETVEMT